MWNLTRLVVVGLALSASHATQADDPPEVVPETHDEDQKARVAYLIEMLASKNKAPVVKGNVDKGEDRTIHFPDQYNKTLQVPVYLAVQQLLREGEGAIAPLLAHVGDERYAYSVNFDNADYNVSVSRACDSIARKILVPYKDQLHDISRSQNADFPKIDSRKVSLATWWEEHKSQGLIALQLEAIEASRTKMKYLNPRTASTIHPYAERLPIDEFNRLRAENLARLKGIRRAILETGKPCRPDIQDLSYHYMFGLPWTGRRHNK